MAHGARRVLAMQFAAVAAITTMAVGVVLEKQPTDGGDAMEVLQMVREMKSTVEADGKLEQQNYDSASCRCKHNMDTKTIAISNNTKNEKRLKTEVADLMVLVSNLTKQVLKQKEDVAKNKQEQKEATKIREQEHAEYASAKTDGEQGMVATEAAIAQMKGAPDEFLQTSGSAQFRGSQAQAQLQTMVNKVKSVLDNVHISTRLSYEDTNVLQDFVDKPEESMKSSQGSGLLQIGANPFGDYQPRGARVIKVLKEQYENMGMDLERSNVEEGEKQKMYEELMVAKREELEELQKDLDALVLEEGEAVDKLAKTKLELDTTKEQLTADKIFLEEETANCKQRSHEWAKAVSVRTKELEQTNKAIKMLEKQLEEEGGDSEEKEKKDAETAAAFLQLYELSTTQAAARRASAYTRLQALAEQYHTLSFARMAVAVKAGGAFTRVIDMVANMIAELRQDEKDDIAHKDRCEGAQAANKNEMEDLKVEIDKTDKKLKTLDESAYELKGAIAEIKAGVKDEETQKGDLLAEYNREKMQAEAADKNAERFEKLIKMVMKQLGMSLVQKSEGGADKEEGISLISTGRHKLRLSRKLAKNLGPVLALLGQEFHQEIELDRSTLMMDDDDFKKRKARLNEVIEVAKHKQVKVEKELADIEERIASAKDHRAQKHEDLHAQQDLKKTLMHDCQWLKTQFEPRQEERQKQIDGLVEAKNIIEGIQEPDAAAELD
eukprot:gnl/TRDRNA2_/TRDRNA2_185447_c0_seq1.p1 gnl/TRDRNA2_/TRDRNA2_185447_c0~~gnl/TRDRNA2_/TRDRNA2_185447_c0_seq1.p1  ORF type:complete len:735 (-),score=261.87 gnl/TRDRNA2_/TRDRNA2_185447_c0_seq1:205-2370(-)